MNPDIRTLALATMASLFASEPALASGPTFSAQSASISAAGATVTAMRVPVLSTTGATSYFDVTVALKPTVSGTAVTGVTASATSAPSQIIQTNGFVAGTYKDTNGNVYTLGGPGVGKNGATAWSIVFLSRSGGCTLYGGATWYTDTGPNNPEYAREQAAKITTTAPSFGVSGGQGYCGSFNGGDLIGAMQSGDTLAISSYTNDGARQDWPTPTLTLTFKLQP